MREEGRSKIVNPHAPRDDKPHNEELWLHPTPQAMYTSATEVKPVLRFEKPEGKKNSVFGKVS